MNLLVTSDRLEVTSCDLNLDNGSRFSSIAQSLKLLDVTPDALLPKPGSRSIKGKNEGLWRCEMQSFRKSKKSSPFLSLRVFLPADVENLSRLYSLLKRAYEEFQAYPGPFSPILYRMKAAEEVDNGVFFLYPRGLRPISLFPSNRSVESVLKEHCLSLRKEGNFEMWWTDFVRAKVCELIKCVERVLHWTEQKDFAYHDT